MATLVLGAVGTALGGPVGGALGSLVGQAIDQQLLGPGPRRGPRLGDLAIQTSAYGTMIPRVYGTMRVAGSVVWATDLKEAEQAVSGGKGGSDELRYSYTASFAVALSSRAGGRIGRVWADGKLLRGAAGDLKVAGTMRLLDGGEEQLADPLIASIEGIGTTPAFRGMVLAVFEDLALAEFGNRLPMLTFELIADGAEVGVGAVLADASGRVVDSGCAEAIGGYAAHGSDRRSAIAPLVELLKLRLGDTGAVLSDREPAILLVEGDQLGCGVERAGARSERTRAPLASTPAGLALTYYDPLRDYQAGLASAGEGVGSTRTVEFAAALQAGQARAMADACLAVERAERERVTLHLPPAFLATRPGDLVGGAGLTGVWQVVKVDVAALVVSVDVVRLTGRRVALPAESGRAAAAVDEAAAPTQLVLLDLPTGSGGSLTLAAASGGWWRPVPVTVEANGTAQPGLTVVRPAVIGRTTTVLGSGSAVVLDELNALEVTLLSGADWLTSCDDDALAMGANMAAIGDELVQFGRAEPIGSRRFRLSRLVRGLRGSEWAVGGHAVGEAFVLLDASRLVDVPVADAIAGALISVQPHGLADAATPAAERTAAGEGSRPPSPCHLRVSNLAGSLAISWVRRSRSGWGWIDGADVPIGEASEAYRVRIACGTAQAEWSTTVPRLDLSSADLAGLGSGAAVVSVVQLGDRGASRPVSMTIAI